ncbi:MAG: hypothetical protein HYV97_18540 [Bdellovibrio sp.]|nr:hypothetical protein [Bdellovibrio sp.]
MVAAKILFSIFIFSILLSSVPPVFATDNRAVFSQYENVAEHLRQHLTQFEANCAPHMEVSVVEECKTLAGRIISEEQRLSEIEADIRTHFNTNVNCEKIESTENYDELITESARVVNNMSCSEEEKTRTRANCAKEVSCALGSSLLGVVSSGYELLAHYLPSLPTDCINSDNNCMTHIVTALLKSVWSLITGVWDLIKMAGTWAGDRIVDLYHWAVGAEDATSNAQLAVDKLSESQFEQIKRDPVAFFKNLFNVLWEGIKEWLKTDIFCEEWKGVPHFGTCIKPYTDFDCMSCRTMIAGTCAAAGVIIAEVVPSFLTGGGLAAVKWGAKGASGFAKFIKASRAYRTVVSHVDDLSHLKAIRTMARIGETVTRTITRTRTVVRFVVDPALNVLKRSFRAISRRMRNLRNTAAYAAAMRRVQWMKNTRVARIMSELNSAHTRLHRAVFHAGESMVDSTIERAVLRRGTRALSTEARVALRTSPEAHAFKEAYQGITLNTNNEEFLRLMDAPVPAGKKAIFFDVENSVLKPLNDYVLEDKGLSDAVNGMFFKNFMDKVSKNPQLASKMTATYSDYKSIRLMLTASEGDEAALIRRLLSETYNATLAEFSSTLEAAKLGGLWQNFQGPLGNPRTWFLAGTGQSSVEANMAARAARAEARLRTGESASGHVPMANFSDHMARYYQEFHQIENLRKSLEGIDILKAKGIMQSVEGGKHILSREAIEVLRKVKRSDFPSDAAHRAAIAARMKKLFAVQLEDHVINGMVRYFEGIDGFSPPIFSAGRVPIPIDHAPQGVVSVDFAGLGTDNAYETMQAMARLDSQGVEAGQLVDSAFKDVRAAQDLVSRRVEVAQKSFNETARRIGGEGSTYFSGDDGMFFPTQAFSQEQRRTLVAELGRTNPGQFRVTFVESRFPDGSPIPAQLNSQMVVKAENLEKSMRKMFVGSGSGNLIPPTRANQLMAAIEFHPTNAAGAGKFNLFLGGDISDKERKIIERAFRTVVAKEHRLNTAGTVFLPPAVAAGEVLQNPAPIPSPVPTN